jgi:predicted lipid-binding transport protein (Tim44 family)
VSDELNPDVRHLVDLARKARTPGAEDKLRLARKLAAPLAAGAALGSAKAASASIKVGFFGATSIKVGAAVLVLGAASTFALWHAESPQPPRAPMSRPSAAKRPLPKADEPAPQREPEPAKAAPEAAPPDKPSVSPSSSRARAAHELEEEAALLHEAQAAWRAGQSSRALELSNRHAQRFPRSQLANERDVLRVLSLCRLGQKEAAKQVGSRLIRSAKGSPWYQSVADSCAAD